MPDDGAVNPAPGDGDVTPAPVDGGIGDGAVTPPTAPPSGGASLAGAEPAPKKGFSGVYGKLTDSRSGEALIEAQVKVTNPPPAKTAVSDVDGNYYLKLKPGSYDLRVFYELYQARKVSRVVVRAGEATRLDVQLTADKDAVQEVVVEARADITTEAVQIVRRQKAATVSDAVSAEQIARSPDSNASDAAKRVVAVTIENDKYLIVRGLSGRYSTTMLNGVPLPSPDPDIPAAPLDLFPAALLANLTVAKTFVPDLPGNWVGGALNIETRTFPTKFTLTAQLKGFGDTVSTLKTGTTYQGGSTDFLGIDDGTRALPAPIPRDRLLPFPPEQAGRQHLTESGAFRNIWTMQNRTLPPGFSGALTLGDTIRRNGHQFGYYLSANYGLALLRRERTTLFVAPDGTRQGSAISVEAETTERASFGGLATFGWIPLVGHQISAVALYSHSTDNSSSEIDGRSLDEIDFRRTRLRFTQRSMLVSQLIGDHVFGANRRYQLNWQGNFARVTQNEPDTRDLLQPKLVNEDTMMPFFAYGKSTGESNRLFTDLSELQGGGALDFAAMLKQKGAAGQWSARLKLGGTYLYSTRDYLARRFEFPVYSESLNGLDASKVFVPENFSSNKVGFGENFDSSDGLGQVRHTGGAYFMLDVEAGKRVRLLGGLRVEASHFDIFTTGRLKPALETCVDCDPNLAPGRKTVNERTDVNPLPAGSVVIAINDKMNLRAAYGWTIARPNFRELSPSVYYDYARGRRLSGNPDLKQADIQNADLRWEWFFGTTELIGASVFYKYLTNPIERNLNGNLISSFQNSDSANVVGGEIEARVSAGRIWKPLTNLSLYGNFSIIHSEVDYMGQKRPLFGQSPYLVNVDVGYHIVEWGTRIHVLYNVFGPRLFELGVGQPHVFEEPVHKLDFSISQQLPAHLRLKFTGNNLLNYPVVQRQGQTEVLRFQTGAAFAATLELNI